MNRLQVQNEPGPSSSASSLASRTLRRRSASPRIPRIDTLPSFSSGIDVSDLGASTIPTIKRVQTSGSSGREAYEDVDYEEQQTPLLHTLRREKDEHLDATLDNVHLTPRPDLQDRAQTNASAITGATQISLPTPDYSAERTSSHGGIFDFFRVPLRPSSSLWRKETREPSDSRATRERRSSSSSSQDIFWSNGIPGFARLKSHLRMPSFNRTQSGGPTDRPTHSRKNSSSGPSVSDGSQRSYGTSVDSGKTYMVSGVQTTEKFTHRWPLPKTMSRVNSDYSPLDTAEPYESVESLATGFGFEYAGSWTIHKWFLFFSVLSVFAYSIVALVYSVLTWYQTWDHADVMLVSDFDVLILITLSACLLLLSALVGLTGTLLNSRPLLAVYALLLWPTLVAMLAVGYVGYKRAAFALDRKLNRAWSQFYTDLGRAVIQDSLRCCGFTDPTHEATYNSRCFPRAPRPGCKGPLLRFERANLGALWRAAFAAVPLHLANVIVALLCANHVTKRFGKGIMPRRYRLRATDVKRDAQKLLQHFASEGGVTRMPSESIAKTGLGCIREDREERFE